MMAIPLPALQIRTPSTNQTVSEFANLVKLRELGQAQQRQAQLDQQQQTMNQQQIDANNLKAQQQQQQITTGQVINSLVAKHMQNGKLDQEGFNQDMAQNGMGALAPEVVGTFQKAEQGAQSLRDSQAAYQQAMLKFGNKVMDFAHSLPHNTLGGMMVYNALLNGGDTVGAQTFQAHFNANPDATWAQIDQTYNANHAKEISETQSRQQQADAAAQNAATNAKREAFQESQAPAELALKQAQANAANARAAAAKSNSKSQTKGVTDAQIIAIENKKNAALQKLEADFQKNLMGQPPTQEQLAKLNEAKQRIQDEYEGTRRAVGLQTKHFSYAQQGGKPLTAALAQQFLARAGGDKDKARQMARAAGYTF